MRTWRTTSRAGRSTACSSPSPMKKRRSARIRPARPRRSSGRCSERSETRARPDASTTESGPLEIHSRAPGLARNLVERGAGHVGHFAHAGVRQQGFTRVIAVLVAYQAQLHDRETRRERAPQDAVVENGERRRGYALLRGLAIPRRNERAQDRRQAGLRGGGDQADKDVLEFVGGR